MNVPKNKTSLVAGLRAAEASAGNRSPHDPGRVRVISFGHTGERLQLQAVNVAAKIQVPDSAQICIVCRREIVDGQWFCRLPRNQTAWSNGEFPSRLICTPRCALRYFEALRPEPNGYEKGSICAERSLHMLIGLEKPKLL